MQKVTDQVAHFVCAAAVVMLFAPDAGALGLGIGLALGLVREVSEAGGSRITWAEVKAHFTKGIDPWLDLTFWTLGGLTGGAL